MKNKKGYTLVELLAVIVIIAIIATLAITNIAKKSGQLKDISSSKVEELITSSAKSYFYNNNLLRQQVKSNGSAVIQYKTLKDNDYINDNLMDIRTYKKIDIDSSCVYVRYSDYKYIFTVEQPCNHN